MCWPLRWVKAANALEFLEVLGEQSEGDGSQGKGLVQLP